MDIPQNLAELAGWGGIPVVVLFLEFVVKSSLPNLDKRWLPSIAIASGIVWCLVLAALLHLPYGEEAAKGFVVGMLAVGGYSGIRATSGH